ncbi:MAG TPA: DUF1015 domain-containing protein [Armatimonadota bacterium]
MSTLVKPFRGWRYDPARAGELSSLLAPPYDIINREQQAEYCLRSPYNIVHLDLGEPSGPGIGDPRRYSLAAEELHRWQQEGVLARDAQPCFYLYEEQYLDPLGRPQTQRGIVGAVELHDYEDRVVLPHEGTLRGPKIDRLDLMRACECAFSQIFALYSDPELTVETLTAPVLEQEPYFDVTDASGVRHREWVLSDPELVAALSAALENHQIVIADGHHRYETALGYRNEYREKHGIDPEAPAERVTMFLANTEAGGLTIVAAHRMLGKLPAGTWERLATCPAKPFEVGTLVLPRGSDAEVALSLVEMLARWRERGSAFVAYGKDRRAYLLFLDKQAPLPEDYGLEHSETWRRLDVTTLHNLVIGGLLGLTGEYAENGENITFSRYAEEAVSLVEAGKIEMALLLNPTGVDQVMSISASGDRMPQKGTYFSPKLQAGIVLYDLATG